MSMAIAGFRRARPARTRHEHGPHAPYSAVARILHWTTAGLVFAMIACGVVMTQLGGGPVADWLFTAHKMTGVGVFGLVLLRWINRLVMRLRGQWRSQSGHRRIHGLLYAALFATPLLGWAGVSDFGARAVFFGLSLPEIWPEGAGYATPLLTAHAYLAFGILALVFVHIGLAMQDHVMRRAGHAD
jgi:cytochrome b561